MLGASELSYGMIIDEDLKEDELRNIILEQKETISTLSKQVSDLLNCVFNQTKQSYLAKNEQKSSKVARAAHYFLPSLGVLGSALVYSYPDNGTPVDLFIPTTLTVAAVLYFKNSVLDSLKEKIAGKRDVFGQQVLSELQSALEDALDLGEIPEYDMQLSAMAQWAQVPFEITNEAMWKNLEQNEKERKLQELLPGFFSDEERAQVCENNGDKKDFISLINNASLYKAMGEAFKIETAFLGMSDEKVKAAFQTHITGKDKNINEKFQQLEARIKIVNDMLFEKLPECALKLLVTNEFQSVIDEKYNNSWRMKGARIAQFALVASFFGLALFGSNRLMDWLKLKTYKKLQNASALFFNDKIHKRWSRFLWWFTNANRAYTERPLKEFEDTRPHLNKQKT